MPDFLKTYGTTLGPVGIPMSDTQAFALDAILKQLPEEDRVVRKAALLPALAGVEPGERADISWISTEAPDRDREIVLAKGVNDSHYKLNPLVTLGHCYYMPPVGRSLVRRVADHPSGYKGILAKTHYPPRPADWPAGQPWEPDDVLSLIHAGLLNGKSIGFIPVKRRYVEDSEREKRPELAGVRAVIEEALLLEYAVCPIPVNPLTVTQQVSKSVLKAAGWPEPPAADPKSPEPDPVRLAEVTPQVPDVPFATEAEVRRAIDGMIGRCDFGDLARRAAADTLDRRTGKV